MLTVTRRPVAARRSPGYREGMPDSAADPVVDPATAAPSPRRAVTAPAPQGKPRKVPRIIVLGGGSVGLYAAHRLRRRLGKREAAIVIVDPRAYMTYAPFLPEAAAGSIDPRNVVAPLRRALKDVDVLQGKVTEIRHAERTVQVTPEEGASYWVTYDHLIVGLGSVARTLPIPGLAEVAIGFKNDKGGFELRNKNYKGSTRPKYITFIRGTHGGQGGGIHLFEGWSDYLSAIIQQQDGRKFRDDTIVLNSLSNLAKGTAYIKDYGYRTAFTWMDNDQPGQQATASLDAFFKTEAGLLHSPMNPLYAPYKDVNAWHMVKLGLTG